MTWLARENTPSDPRRQLHKPKKPASSAPSWNFRSAPNSSTHLGLWARSPTQALARPSPTPWAQAL